MERVGLIHPAMIEAGMLVWCGLAVGLALLAGVLRPLRREPCADEPRATAAFFAVVGVLGLCVWFLAQMTYAMLRRPPVDPLTNALQWPPIDLAFIGIIGAGVGFAVTIALISASHRIDTLGLSARRIVPGLTVGALGIVIALPIVFWVLQATLFTLREAGIEHPAKHELMQAIDAAHDWRVTLAATCAAVIAAPLFEELIFRGLIQGSIARATRSPWLAIGIASTLFAVIHPWWTIPPIFVLSVILGVIYHRTQNLWAAIFAHALFNAFSLLTTQ